MDKNTNDLVIQLARGINQRRLYFPGHPKVQDAARGFLRLLNDVTGEKAFFLGVAEGKLVHEGRYLVGPTIVGSRLAEFAEMMSCGGFLFKQGMGLAEVISLLSLAAGMKDKVSLDQARAGLTQNGITHLELSPPYDDNEWFGQYYYSDQDNHGGLEDDPDLDMAVPVFRSLFNTVETSHGAAGQGHELDLDQTRNVAESLMKSAGTGLTDLLQLVRYPDFDSYTVGHSVRVAMLAVLVGTRVGLASEQLQELAVAGMLHDVGKAKIPDEILFKPGRLDPGERLIIETHTELGAEILLGNKNAGALAVAVAWGHHRHPGGGGYPETDIVFDVGAATDLIHVCDVFEALTAVRPYKQALSARRAFEIMLMDKDSFSLPVLAGFIRAVGLYPPGSEVLLSNGEQAVVAAAGTDVDRPQVRVTHSAAGLPLDRDDQQVYNLADPSLGLSVESTLLAG